jgi:hypothetical protein
MKKLLYITILFFINEISFGQNLLTEIVEINPNIDSLNNKLVKKYHYDSENKLISETNLYFQALDSKNRSYGQWDYFYNNNKLKKSLYTNRVEGDTICIEYKYFGNIIKINKKELITESKVKDGLVYGDGTPNGCIVPREALDFYKIWVTRLNKKVKYNKGKIIREIVNFDYKTNPYILKFYYSKNGLLEKTININKRTNELIWEEIYTYSENSIVRTREYFIKYWNKIPPKENEVKHIDNNGNVVKIDLKNSKDGQDGIIYNSYKNGLLTEQELFDQNNKLIRKLLYKYK